MTATRTEPQPPPANAPATTGIHVRPHVREYLADTLAPLALYRRFAGSAAGAFLFESVTGGEQVSRYSFLGVAPSRFLRVFADRVELSDAADGVIETWRGDPLQGLRRWVEGFAVGAAVAEDGAEAAVTLPRFAGGWVGTFGFDIVRLIERLPSRHHSRVAGAGDAVGERPCAVLARFDRLLAFDHARHRLLAISNEIEGEVDRATALAGLEELERLVTRDLPARGLPLPRRRLEPLALPEAGLPSGPYRAAVESAKAHIAAGDIFQVVLSRRWTVPTTASPLALYRAARLVNPSPYMVLLELPGIALIGSSPEMLVRVEGRKVETRPIAGTRHRGANAAEDDRLAAELLADEKECAEHVMLVDLGRNDVGRVSSAASVSVPQFMGVERYSHVMHMVSSVVGELAPHKTPLDALFSCFPAGTVSGAPKIRALEIIDQLEPEGRGAYAGAVGYVSFTGDLDTCITIRTLVVEDGRVTLQAGGGIVADSDPAAEERETENKAAALLQAARLAEELEERPGSAR
jgi:anthranilate synthase component 1